MQFVIETQSRERLDRNRSLVVTDRLGADCPMSVFDSARGRFLVADADAVAVADAGKRDALEPVCGITLLPESQAEQAYTRCRRCRTGSRWRCSLWQTFVGERSDSVHVIVGVASLTLDHSAAVERSAPVA